MTTTAAPGKTSGIRLGRPGSVAPLCWASVMMDGFDAVVLGPVLPTLLKRHEWGITTGTATATATLGLVGMVLGGLVLGVLTDRLGRRRVLICSVAAFSLFTFLGAFAPSLSVFMALRFLAGVGLGGCLPIAIAMVGEFSPQSRTSNATTTTMTGYHVGAVATAALAIILIPRFGWPAMFMAALVPALILVPAMLIALPESPAYLVSQGRHEEARAIARYHGIEADQPVDHMQPPADSAKGLSLLMTGEFARNTMAIFAASFMGLLLVYGLNTWLPQIMQKANYDLGDSLAMLLVLNAGAVAGLLVGGRVGDWLTPRYAAIAWFGAAACFLAALTIRLPLMGMYVLIFLTGFFVFSSQVLVYAFIASNYPSTVRATALGMSAAVGRLGGISGPLLGGFLLAHGLAYPGGFFIFGVVGLLGALAMMCTRTITARADSR